MRAYIVAILLLLIILGAIGGQFYRNMNAMMQSGGPPPPSVIETATAIATSWPDTLDAVGTLEAIQGVAVSSEVSGTVTALHFQSGQSVAAGDPLISLNDSTEKANVAQQRANVKLAKLQYERDAKLLATRSVSQTQYDQTQAALDAAQARLQQALSQLDKKHIRAPFGGIIGISDIKLGDYIEPGTFIAQLEDRSSLEVRFSIPARYFSQLAVGQPLRLKPEGHSKASNAQITAIDSRADRNTGSLAIRAALNNSEALLPGMFVQLSIHLGENQQQVQVPETAVTYSLHGNTVFVVEADKDGVLRAQPTVVTTGLSRDGMTAVLSGLEAGQVVASAGQNKLYPGAAVTTAEDQQAVAP